MSTTEQERPRFYEGQYLGAADLSDVVDYGRHTQARHALGAHTWGIAAGLQLTEVTSPDGTLGVVLTPGYAWDGFGRCVVVLAPYALPAAFFQQITDPLNDPAGVPVDVWVRYAEAETRPAADGFGTCGVDDENGRIAETFRIEIGPRTSAASQRDPLTVAGKSVDAADVNGAGTTLKDTSVAFQTLSDDASALWLIPLGRVQWKPGVGTAAGTFRPRTPIDLAVSESARRYVGVVCGTVSAAAGKITVTDRSADYTDLAHKDVELLHIEGNVAAHGHLRPRDRLIDFRDALGNTQNVPLTIGRTDLPTGEHYLAVGVGTGIGGTNRFSVGPIDAATNVVTENFVVLDNGRVGIGTTKPNQWLTMQGSDQAYLSARATNAPPRELTVGINAAGGLVATATNDALQLGAGGNQVRVTILPTGNVGVANTAPAVPLHVNGTRIRLENAGKTIDLRTDGSAVDVQSDTSDLYLRASGPGGRNRVLINPFPQSPANPAFPDGFVGIATQNPQAQLQVNGNVRLGRSGEYFAPAAAGQNLLILRGNVTALGFTNVGGGGYTVTKNAQAGVFTIAFDQPFLDAPSASVTALRDTGMTYNDATRLNAVIAQIDATQMVVLTSATYGTPQHQSFSFIVTGARP